MNKYMTVNSGSREMHIKLHIWNIEKEIINVNDQL